MKGTLGLLQVAFVVLKLTDVIDWSWWWVLAPLWASLVIWLAALLVLVATGYFSTQARLSRASRDFFRGRR